MKILYITKGQGVDYLNDTIFIGLVNNGHEVTDTNHLWYTEDITEEDRNELYGMGFSISGNLPYRGDIDRNPQTILERINNHYYDCVIYGSIWRCADYIEIVRRAYKNNEIIYLDGEDTTAHLWGTTSYGIYFKRELNDSDVPIIPISFSLPEKKFSPLILEKENRMAYIDPTNTSTYIYKDEKSYYEGYQKSQFGKTLCKGGWDCMRHYEIIGNSCLPFFPKFGDCPRLTMMHWPSDLQQEANSLYNGWTTPTAYENLLTEFYNHAKKNLTSEAMANYVTGFLFQ